MFSDMSEKKEATWKDGSLFRIDTFFCEKFSHCCSLWADTFYDPPKRVVGGTMSYPDPVKWQRFLDFLSLECPHPQRHDIKRYLHELELKPVFFSDELAKKYGLE